MEYWQGPMSVALYVSTNDSLWQQHFVIYTITNYRHNVLIHTVYKDDEVYYPVNVLRNIALQQARTRYAFLVDIDFVPSTSTEQHLHHYKSKLKTKDVFVVPAFAFTKHHDPTDMRAHHNKTTLKAFLFRSNATVKNYGSYAHLRGHRRTNYTKWYDSNSVYKIEYEFGYEPYVLMLKSDVMHYPEIFVGRYYDKVSFFSLLSLNKYGFYVLPEPYVIHQYHYRPSELFDYYTCSWQVLKKWGEILFNQYGVNVEEQGKKKKSYR